LDIQQTFIDILHKQKTPLTDAEKEEIERLLILNRKRNQKWRKNHKGTINADKREKYKNGWRQNRTKEQTKECKHKSWLRTGKARRANQSPKEKARINARRRELYHLKKKNK